MASTSKEVQACAARMLRRLLSGVNPAIQKASLADLRRGVGHTPGDIPQLWGEFLSDLPETMYGRGGKPSREEWAIYTALTLFALHQQGHDPIKEPMHREGESLGGAVGRLATGEATADSVAGLSHYLRGLVQLLRAQDIPLDYAALARDVYLYQNPDTAGQVRLRWGQDFYACYNKNKAEEDENQ